MLLRPALLLVVLTGCPLFNETLPECTMIDASNVQLVASDLDDHMIDITDGSQVPLLGAPQGGHIMLVGARIKAASDCQLIANAALRDVATNRVLGLEQRPLLLDRHHDGWAVPRHGIDEMPNLAVCPASAATTTIYNHEYKLEVTLMTLDEQMVATATALITPTCQPGDGYCEGDCGL